MSTYTGVTIFQKTVGFLPTPVYWLSQRHFRDCKALLFNSLTHVSTCPPSLYLYLYTRIVF